MTKVRLNHIPFEYKGIRLELIQRSYHRGNPEGRAKRFTLGGTNQNVWIPNKHLNPDGTLKEGENIDYVFRRAQKQLELAGYLGPIIGIKRRTILEEEM
jgi:hypothetical protein